MHDSPAPGAQNKRAPASPEPWKIIRKPAAVPDRAASAHRGRHHVRPEEAAFQDCSVVGRALARAAGRAGQSSYWDRLSLHTPDLLNLTTNADLVAKGHNEVGLCGVTHRSCGCRLNERSENAQSSRRSAATVEQRSPFHLPRARPRKEDPASSIRRDVEFLFALRSPERPNW